MAQIDVQLPAEGEEEAPSQQAPTRQSDVFDDVWRLFSSPKLAIVLILTIVAASVVGSLVMQPTTAVFGNPEAMRSWVERARPKYGVFTDLFNLIGFFGIFQTFWFRALLGLLCINTIVCTINRLPAVWRQVFDPRVRPGEGLFERGRPRHAWLLRGLSRDDASPSLHRGLRGARYRVIERTESGGIYFFADKFRFARFGTIATHAGLLLVFVGVVLGGRLGYFADDAFAVTVGTTREIGHGTGLSLYVDEFVDEYYPQDGRPKDYRSEVVLYKQGQPVAQATVRVNEPLIYEGVRVHQSYYGSSALISVTDETGKSLFRGPVELTWRTNPGNRPVGQLELPVRNLNVWVVGTAGKDPKTGRVDEVVRPGEMLIELYQGKAATPTDMVSLRQGEPATIGGLEFLFERELPFTGLRVVRDPSTTFIWVASAMLTLGPILTFFFPHRRLWGRILAEPAGARIVLVGAGQPMAEELERVAHRLQAEAGVPVQVEVEKEAVGPNPLRPPSLKGRGSRRHDVLPSSLQGRGG